jgi:hypothetical protein
VAMWSETNVVDLAGVFRNCDQPFATAAITIFALVSRAAAPLTTTLLDLFTAVAMYFAVQIPVSVMTGTFMRAQAER